MTEFLKRVALLSALAIISLFSFAGIALAADAATPSDSSSLLDLARPVYDAFAGGHYAYGAALLVILLVALTKRYFGDRISFLHSDAGGSLLALVAAMSGAMATALAAPGASLTLSLLKTALLVGVGAAGGYAMLKNLLVDPILKPLAAKAPAWMQPLFSLLFWIFDKPDSTAAADATKAGDAAVAAKPAAGLDGLTGTPKDIK